MDTNVKTCKKIGLCTHESISELGAWVYSGLGIDSIFKRFNNIADAVKVAVQYEDAHVIHNGVEIKYGVISDSVVYYHCINTGKVVIIDLTEE